MQHLTLTGMTADDSPRNHWRQIATLVGAIAQIAAIIWVTGTGAGLDPSSRAGFESPVFPAAYTFAIWLLIYPGALVYAVYQALPSQRLNPLHVHSGWWIAAAFAALTLWPIFQALGWLWLTVVCIFVMFAALLGAFSTWMRYPPRTSADRYLAVLPISVFFGYVTVATTLTIALVVPRLGLLDAIGLALTPWAIIVLLGAGLLASLLTQRSGGNLGYALTIMWSLLGIVVQNVLIVPNETVALTAAAMALLVAVVLVRTRAIKTAVV